MRCPTLTFLGLIALSIAGISPARTTADEKPDAWPKLDWKKGAPSPFARVESPTAVDHWSLSRPAGKEWQPEADLPDPRGHVRAIVLGGKIYALGGDHGHDVKQIDVASCHRYDPATKKWGAIAGLPDGRSHFES